MSTEAATRSSVAQREVDDAHAAPVRAEPLSPSDPLPTGGARVGRGTRTGSPPRPRSPAGARRPRTAVDSSVGKVTSHEDAARRPTALTRSAWTRRLVDDRRERVQAHDRMSGFPNVGSA